MKSQIEVVRFDQGCFYGSMLVGNQPWVELVTLRCWCGFKVADWFGSLYLGSGLSNTLSKMDHPEAR